MAQRTEVNTVTGLLYNKGYDDTDEQPNEEIHRVRPGMVPSAGASVTTKLGCAVWMCLPTLKLSELQSLWIFMKASSCRHDWSLTQFEVLSPPQRLGLGRRVSKYGLVSLETSHPPEAIQESTQNHLIEQKMFPSPRNSKGFRSLVSGTRVKDQFLEQKMLLASLSLGSLYEFGELCVRNGDETKCMYFLLYHNITAVNMSILMCQGLWSHTSWNQTQALLLTGHISLGEHISPGICGHHLSI